MTHLTEENRIHRILLARACSITAPLAEAIKSVGPVSLRRGDQPNLGNFLARAIVGQQLSASVARSIWMRLTLAARDAQLDVLAFAESNADVVRASGVSTRKILALQSVRVAERAGTLREAQLDWLSPQDLVTTLNTIHGVGPWTCDMALIFYYHFPDIWPEGDAAVQRTFARLIGRRSAARTAAKFSPHQSALALVMWRVVDEKLVT